MVDSALVASLRKSLAETWAFYFKAHSFHWNVRGALFHQLHGLFGDIYEDAHSAVDDLAERIRTLDADAPFSLDGMVKQSVIRFTEKRFDAGSMVYQLYTDNQTVSSALSYANKLAIEADNDGLANLIQERMDKHAKWGWMLKALLESGKDELN